MKRGLILLTLLALATGCGPKAATPTTTQNPFSSTNAAAQNRATPPTNAAGGAGASNQTYTDAQLKKTAADLVEMYIKSHNDKTLEEYKVDVHQFFTQGLAEMVGQSASKGQDYAHPVESYKIDVQKVQNVDPQDFFATVATDVTYKGEQLQHMVYHIKFTEVSGQWYIRLINA